MLALAGVDFFFKIKFAKYIFPFALLFFSWSITALANDSEYFYFQPDFEELDPILESMSTNESEITPKIDQFFNENGHLPNAKNSSELMEIVGIDGNLVPSNSFEYILSSSGENYVLKLYNKNGALMRYYDSETEESVEAAFWQMHQNIKKQNERLKNN